MNTEIRRIIYFYVIFRTVEQNTVPILSKLTRKTLNNIVMLKPVSMQHIKDASKLTRKTLRKCNIVMLIPMSMQHVTDVSTCVSVLCRPPSTFSVSTDVHTLSLSVSYR